MRVDCLLFPRILKVAMSVSSPLQTRQCRALVSLQHSEVLLAEPILLQAYTVHYQGKVRLYNGAGRACNDCYTSNWSFDHLRARLVEDALLVIFISVYLLFSLPFI